MIIIAGHVVVPADQRTVWVDAFRDLVGRARDADGCIEVAITADSVDLRRIDILEIWRDAAALDSWRSHADAPDLGIEPIEMSMKRYDATDGGPLF